MGTSTNYSGPPHWQSAKTETTRLGGAGPISDAQAASVLSTYVGQMLTADSLGFGPALATGTQTPDTQIGTGGDGLGGNRGSATSGGSGGGGGGGGGRGSGGGGGRPRRIGRSARTVARGIGSFLSDVVNLGFAAALAQRGITDLSGKTPEEIVMTLADIFGGPANLIDETALREALIALMQDWTEDVQTIEGLDQAVLRAAQDISVTLRRFLAHYIFEVYKTVGYHGILEVDPVRWTVGSEK